MNTEVTARYDYRMTPYMESLLRGRAADDPLSLQFLPDARELLALPHEISDPIGDEAFSPVKGIVHRYPDRVLLKIAHSCPVYCRFCFRREMIGSRGEPLQGHTLDAAIDYLRAHPKIWEVILTGGDPLTLSGRRLGLILDKLASIEHLSVLRVHSRVPIVAPRSIDESMLDALQRSLPVYLAIHVNHPDEITEEVVTAIRRLTDRGVILLSQTVLLKGVNDCVPVLDALFRRLVRLKVRPYYLHHPDLALCMPTYVLDIPGGFGKVPIGPSYVGEKSVSGFRVVQDANEIGTCTLNEILGSLRPVSRAAAPAHSVRHLGNSRRRGGRSSIFTGQPLSTLSQSTFFAIRRKTTASSSASNSASK